VNGTKGEKKRREENKFLKVFWREGSSKSVLLDPIYGTRGALLVALFVTICSLSGGGWRERAKEKNTMSMFHGYQRTTGHGVFEFVVSRFLHGSPYS
jgi:hypothetical protein